jgi:hypothetical protein
MLADAWNDVKSDTLNKGWGKLCGKSNKNVQGKINGMELAGVVRFQVAPSVDYMKSMNGSTVMLMTQAFKS